MNSDLIKNISHRSLITLLKSAIFKKYSTIRLSYILLKLQIHSYYHAKNANGARLGEFLLSKQLNFSFHEVKKKVIKFHMCECQIIILPKYEILEAKEVRNVVNKNSVKMQIDVSIS